MGVCNIRGGGGCILGEGERWVPSGTIATWEFLKTVLQGLGFGDEGSGFSKRRLA